MIAVFRSLPKIHDEDENGDKNCFENWELCLFWQFSFHDNRIVQSSHYQSCKSDRAFRVGFRFGPGSSLKLTKISGLILAWAVLFVLDVQKNNQTNLAILLNFLDLIQLSGFFGHDLGFKLIFGFGPGSGLWYRVRAWTCRPVYNSAHYCSGLAYSGIELFVLPSVTRKCNQGCGRGNWKR